MFGREKADRELDREMRGYVELLTEEKMRAGMSPADARRAALLEVGGVEQVKERVRDERAGATMETLLQDLRYALRSLGHAPTYTIAAVLTLAIGIGANTAIFSAIDGVLLKPFPFSHSDRIVTLFQNDRKKGIDRDDVAPGNFHAWRERTRAFSGMAAAEPFDLTYSGPDGEEHVGNWNVTQDFFTVLDARPVRGRVLRAEDFDQKAKVVVLTYDSWQGRFGADEGIIGRVLRLRGELYTVVGVLPRDFSYLGNLKRYEMFTPKVLDSMEVNIRSSGWYHVVARLQPGVTPEQGAADLNRVAEQLATEYPSTNRSIYVTVVGLRDGIVGSSSRALVLLLGAVALVLLVACTNVANLSLARMSRRSREFSVRAALGAGPRRIARQVLTECFLVALAGGLAGTALAFWGVGAIRALAPATLPRVEEMHVDARALVFALVVVVFATFLFGLFPALRAGAPGAGSALGSGARAAGSVAHARMRGVLVVAEVALAIVLMVAAGLLTRSFVLVTSGERGYRSDHVLTSTLFIWQWYRKDADRAQFVSQLVDQVSNLPGVEAAGVTSSLPLADAIGADQSKFTVPGQSVARGEEPSAHVTVITPGAFGALRMQLKRGRLLTAADDSASVPVTVISESMAQRYFAGEDPIGRSVTVAFYSRPVARQIVGVVADIRQTGLDQPAEPTIYIPHAQAPTGGITLLLRTRNEPRTLEREAKRAVAALNPAVPLAGTRTLDDVVADSLKARRFALALFGCFAGAALLLAVIGVYGVMSHSTAERSKEFGVRLALGAQPRDIVRMVVAQGLAAAGIGLVIGSIASAALTSLLQSMLYGVSPLDPITFSIVAVVMLGTALLACYVPARRATAVHPVSALRLS